MSHVATLLATCIRKTCDLLVNGMWDSCEENPFSCMPVSIIQNLLSCLWPKELEFLSKASLVQSRLLLTSGRLEHITLHQAEDEEDYATLLGFLTPACQNLRSLSILCERYEDLALQNIGVEQALQELLQNCVKLERLHSCVYFEPHYLRNCRNLEVLRFHFDLSDTEDFFTDITSDLLNRLESIEVFALCYRSIWIEDDECFRIDVTAELLDKCPRLISLGFLDSSSALKNLHDRDLENLETPRRLQLRRCYWNAGSNRSESEYNDRIRTAALLCPMVEVLGIVVRYSTDVRYLKTMRNLTRLTLYLYLEHDLNNFGKECFSLFEEIGPQLRYLSMDLYDEEPLSVNAICGNCPNMRTLELECVMTMEEGVHTCANLLNLESLYVRRLDRGSLFFLLSNCPRLKVLYLDSCVDLEDNAMRTILRENPFAELEVALIGECYLSELGCMRFLQSAVKLTDCCFVAPLLGDDGVTRLVRDMNPSIVCHSGDDIQDLAREHFFLESECSCLF